jgi:hypothetical protein
VNVLLTHLHLDVYDHFGADGWVTPETVDEIASHTFSGKRYALRLTANDLVTELERYDIRAHVERLLSVYEEAAAAFEPRRLALPAQGVEVALMALRARLPEARRSASPGG